MHVEHAQQWLSTFEEATPLLQSWGVRDLRQGWVNVQHLAATVGEARFHELTHAVGRILPRCPAPDMALNNLERLLAAAAATELLTHLLETRGRALEIVLQLFSTSQYFSELLVAHPDYIDMLRVPLRRSPTRAELFKQLQDEVDAAHEDSAILRAFRRYRERQILRIGANDIIRDRPLEEITKDISRVADIAVQVALATAVRQVTRRFGEPFAADGWPSRCVVLAFGKLGGEELNYSSDIDLMMVYDEEGGTRGGVAVANSEFFSRVTSELVRQLSAHPQAYRVDLRLRPEGERGPLARSLRSTLAYYDTLGRTWERQAMIKVRPIAGDMLLGQEFMRTIEPFVYRTYLSFAEINEIKAIKRRIEHKTTQAGDTMVDVKAGHGGIRDVEFVIQFLQLLNGGDLREVRQRNTLLAIAALEDAGCLTDPESRILEDTYRFLRKVEHRLQLMFDLQTHELPAETEELTKLARRMGYEDQPLENFRKDYQEKTNVNRRILNHLLHDTFKDDHSRAAPESDLILDPAPEPETIRQVLSRYPFRDIMAAYQNLMQLSQESAPFLSARRCRQFLANIAPQLLQALAETPDPDMALTNLEKVTASLGGKGVLWELFTFNLPSLHLYVDLCAWSQFLSEILIKNPGMIDELLDSLVLNKPRAREQLRAELTELCRGAEDTDLILHSYQDKELLRIGVNDILGKDTLQTTLTALSDLAEVMLVKIAELAFPTMTKRFGPPHLGDGDQPCRYVLLSLGKLGGREMSYNSDLDLILVYEGDGRTAGRRRELGRKPSPEEQHLPEETDNFHFFSEYAQRIIKMASYIGPRGRLYQVDMRLRPTGKSGGLAIPLVKFEHYYTAGGAQLWERQALTRARVVHGDVTFANEVMTAVANAAFGLAWQPQFADDIAQMRRRLEASRGERDLKRGFGGIVDVEFLVQLFQIKYAGQRPALRLTNMWDALDALLKEQLLETSAHAELRSNYDFLRRVESRLRIVHNLSQDELPNKPEDLDKLARRLGYEPDGTATAAEVFLRDMERRTSRTRELFLELVAQERSS